MTSIPPLIIAEYEDNISFTLSAWYTIIGVASAFVVALIVAIIYYCVVVRRRRKKQKESDKYKPIGGGYVPREQKEREMEVCTISIICGGLISHGPYYLISHGPYYLISHGPYYLISHGPYYLISHGPYYLISHGPYYLFASSILE